MRKIISILMLLALMAGFAWAQNEVISFEATSGVMVKLGWSYPDTCDMNNVANFKILYGMRDWRSASTQITLDKSVLTNSLGDSYNLFVEVDTSLSFGGYQYYFALQALDNGGAMIARSDTITIMCPFYADVALVDSGKTVVNIYDMSHFTDYYKAAYGKEFQWVLPRMSDNKFILRLIK